MVLVRRQFTVVRHASASNAARGAKPLHGGCHIRKAANLGKAYNLISFPDGYSRATSSVSSCFPEPSCTRGPVVCKYGGSKRMMEAAWKNLVRQARSSRANDDALFDRAVCALKAARAMKKRGLTAPSFGGGELKLVWSIAATSERAMVRRACAAVVASLLCGDVAAQGRAIASGTAWRLDEWLVVSPAAPDDDDEAGRVEESVRQMLAGASSSLTRRQPLPEGVKDRKVLMEIRELPDPAESPIAVALCPSLRQPHKAPPQAPQPASAPKPTETKPKEKAVWSGRVTLRTTTDRDVDAVVSATLVAVGDVVGDDTDDLRANPSYLCCHRVGTFRAPSDDGSRVCRLDVIRLRIASQGSQFEAYVSRPVLARETTIEPAELVGNGGVVQDICKHLVRLPWFSSDDPRVPVWRVPPRAGVAQKAAVRCVQLLASSAGRSAAVARAVLLAVVSEINKAVLLRTGLAESAHREFVECRDRVVETLKSLTLAALAAHAENRPVADAPSFEAARLRTIDTLLRIASNREDPPSHPREPQSPGSAPETEDFSRRVFLGSTASEDRVRNDDDDDDDSSELRSPLARGVAAVLSRAEILAARDGDIRHRKRSARESSAALARLRLSVNTQQEEDRRQALEKRIDIDASYVKARRARFATAAAGGAATTRKLKCAL